MVLLDAAAELMLEQGSPGWVTGRSPNGPGCRAGLTADPVLVRLVLAVVDGVVVNALARGLPLTTVARQAGDLVRLVLPGPPETPWSPAALVSPRP